jgi:hypothetical protein
MVQCVRTCCTNPRCIEDVIENSLALAAAFDLKANCLLLVINDIYGVAFNSIKKN